MRTTLDLPDHLFKEAKSKAARRGVPLKVLMIEALEKELRAPESQSVRPRRLRAPLIRSRRPGHLKISNTEIDELLG